MKLFFLFLQTCILRARNDIDFSLKSLRNKNTFYIYITMKTKGSETVNKNINWRVKLKEGGDRYYKNLRMLCEDLNINRTNVYKIQTGRAKPLRKKNIIEIEKIYLQPGETGVE